MSLIQGLLHNKILVTAVTAWATAQMLKLFTNFYKEKKMNVERLVGAGGMPSSHSALVVSLTAAIGFNSGWDSPLFALACVLSGIVMYDAAGVRRAAGKQAKVLNRLINEYRAYHTVREGRLKELLGHTPVEVSAGALLGAGMAYIFHIYW